jgi:HEAT repeat protein
MNLIAERSVDEWFSSLPKTGGIYRLIDQTMSGWNKKERISAVIALGESGDPRAVYPVMDCCSDKDAEIRQHAISALFKLKSGRAVRVLIERLKDKSEQVLTRKCAAAALAEIRSYSAVEGLKAQLQDADDDPVIQSYITEVLGLKKIS